MVYTLPARWLRLLVVAQSLAVAAAAQAVTVGPLGSGAQYTRIVDGIAAVPAGGVVLVAAGVYAENDVLVIDKPMTLLGAGSGQTTVELQISSPLLLLVPLVINNLAVGKEVVVAGMSLSMQPTFVGTVASSVTIRDCAGPVTLSDIATDLPYAVSTDGLVQVRNAAMVTFEKCLFRVGSSAPNAPPPGMLVQESLVHVSQCTVQGALASVPFGSSAGFDGAAGIVARGSIVRIAQSHIKGGIGAQPGVFSTVTGVAAGGAAIAAESSQILVRGAPGNLLQGGKGGRTNAGFVAYGSGGAAIQLDGGSLAATTPDTVLVAGLDGDDQLTTPVVNGPGLHAPLAFPLPVLSAVDKLLAPGQAASFDLAGEPGAVCLSLLSLHQVPAFVVSGILGVFTLQFPAVVPLPTVILDAAGNGGFSVPLPANPALVGTVAHSQAVSFGPGGWVVVSAPTCFAVR
jgi:hypothetical protein